MFKWPNGPKFSSPRNEIADYIELLCWRDRQTSIAHVTRAIARSAENDYTSGVVIDESTENNLHGGQTSVTAESALDEAFAEIEMRRLACGGDYPFEIANQGHTLVPTQGIDSDRSAVYLYLLLATRLNMQLTRDHAGIDGTLLFEYLCADVAKEYFGNRANSLVFGTAAHKRSFPGKISDLCERINEGGRFDSTITDPNRRRDGKLDVVAWIPFADNLPGKLIGFGQCKTGTHYRDSLTHLQPDQFCAKWMRFPLANNPIRMFFIAEALRLVWGDREDASRDAGLLLDRCRIVELSSGVNVSVMDKVRNWTAAAAQAVDLPDF